jgi:SWI/SNF-related matrix-associated actin-dependent regulator 1 of chromatin subfamily A
LFPYQKNGVKWLAGRDFALLADEPGLGKSAQAVRACEGLGRILVLCPASLRGNWAREFARFSDTRRTVDAVLGTRPVGADVTIASYDFAARHATALAGAYDALILDESHYLKNPKSKRTKAVFGPKCDRVGGIAENADRVYCLSGTPAPNDPSELWPSVRALAPELLDKRQHSYWGFVTKYCRTKDTGFGLQIVGGRNMGELRTRLDPFILRRKKEDVLPDLPPLRLETLFLDGVSSRELSVLSAEYGGQIEKALAENGIEGLAKLAPHIANLRRLTGHLKVAGVVETVSNEVAHDGKIVLFAYHTGVIETLETELLDAGFGVVVVDGAAPAAFRTERVRRFQEDPSVNVFIGQLTAAGTGLTLTAASEAIIVESSWVPAENEQAAMRIHRIGQRNACRVRFATLADSIDEKINRAVLRKAADIAQLFN